MTYIVSLWYLYKLSLCWIGTPINIRSLIKWWLRFDVIDGSLFFSAWNLYHVCHIINSFYRRMMHEEDERPPNEKSPAYHFSITCTYNGCDFCLLTPSAILALPKCLLNGLLLKFRGFICLRLCSRHCNWNWSALHKDEHKKDAKHKKLLNLLCIVYFLFLCKKLVLKFIYFHYLTLPFLLMVNRK